MFAYTSPVYDVPADPTPIYVFVGVIVGWAVLAPCWPLVESAARRFVRCLDTLLDWLAMLRAPAFVVAACAAFGRVAAGVRYVLNPAAERRRRLGRYLAALPPHSGLTVYEEYEAEINALPSGAARSALRYNFERMFPKPSAATVERARNMRGRARVPAGYVRCLLRGEKPSYYSDVA
jgi:hypothetical protein